MRYTNVLFLQDCLGLVKPDRFYYVSAGDINPSTGKAYAVNPSSGVWDDNYFANHYGGGASQGGTTNGGQSNPVGTDMITKNPSSILGSVPTANLGGTSQPSSDYGSGTYNAATGQGTSALTSFNPVQTGQSNLSSLSGLLNNQSNQTGQYVSDYQKAIAANPSMTQLYNTANTQFNVPQLAQQAGKAQADVNNAYLTSYNQGSPFGATQTQIDANTGNMLKTLVPAANYATNASQAAQNLASQYVQAGQTQNQMNLLPIQSQQQFMMQQQAAAQTGWNQNAANSLNALVQKMQSGVQLSAAEMQMAETLASQEEAYNQAIIQGNTSLQSQYLGQLGSLSGAQIGAQSGIQNQILANQGQLANTIQGQKFANVNGNLVNTLGQSIINPAMLTARGGGVATF